MISMNADTFEGYLSEDTAHKFNQVFNAWSGLHDPCCGRVKKVWYLIKFKWYVGSIVDVVDEIHAAIQQLEDDQERELLREANGLLIGWYERVQRIEADGDEDYKQLL